MRDLIHRAVHLAETHPRADAVLASVGMLAILWTAYWAWVVTP